MLDTYIAGSALAASASLFWTLAPFFFASAVRSLGAWRVNPLRLAGAAAILGLLSGAYLLFDRAAIDSLQSTALVWLALSGVVGLGDRRIDAGNRIGARRSVTTGTTARRCIPPPPAPAWAAL